MERKGTDAPWGKSEWDMELSQFQKMSAYAQVLTGEKARYDGEAVRLAATLERLRNPSVVLARIKSRIASVEEATRKLEAGIVAMWYSLNVAEEAIKRQKKTSAKYGKRAGWDAANPIEPLWKEQQTEDEELDIHSSSFAIKEGNATLGDKSALAARMPVIISTLINICN